MYNPVLFKGCIVLMMLYNITSYYIKQSVLTHPGTIDVNITPHICVDVSRMNKKQSKWQTHRITSLMCGVIRTKL